MVTFGYFYEQVKILSVVKTLHFGKKTLLMHGLFTVDILKSCLQDQRVPTVGFRVLSFEKNADLANGGE